MIIHRTGKINFLLVFFYIGGCMKRFLALLMCIFVLTISIITYFPTNIYAATDFTLSIDWKSVVQGKPNLSYTEAHNAVANHGNIYGSDHIMVFQYTPTSQYYWTLVGEEHVMKLNMSDKQLEAYLQCNNYLATLGHLYNAYNSNNSIGRYLMTKIGALVSDDSPLTTACLDTITNNVNYLNAVEYDSSTGELTLLADQVSALRKELKERYYNLIGLKTVNSSNLSNLINDTKFRSMFDNIEDYNDVISRISDYKCALTYGSSSHYYRVIFLKNDFCDDYLFSDSNNSKGFWIGDSLYYYYPLCVYANNSASDYKIENDYIDVVAYDSNNICYSVPNLKFYINSYGGYTFFSQPFSNTDSKHCNGVGFYANSSVKVFKSYEAIYNYFHGSQNAYLSSKVEEAGEDIKMSINDMNDNIGSKIDDLIDSINNKKEGMSADELQDAIDKALDSISGKIDNIGDNTEETNNKLDSLLSLMSEQNNILLQILGVTEYIAYNNTKEDGSDYTTDDLKNTFNTMYDGVRNAILYGTNTVSNSGAAVSVAAYSSEDLATQDINNLDIHNGLFGKFPFSIPYQLYEWLQVLEAEPVAPVFNYNYGFMIGKKDNPDCNLTIDLSVYEPWANQAKSFERLLFTLLMAVFIYKKFKGNSIF